MKIPRAAALAVLAVLFLLSAAPAQAATLSFSPEAPVVDEAVVFEYSIPICGSWQYTWTIDGQAPPADRTTYSADGDKMTTRFAAAADHVVAVTAVNGDCETQRGEVTARVSDALGGSIAVSPDPPVVGQSATLAATATGGFAPSDYAWDTDDDSAFDDAATRTVQQTFLTPGPHVVRVRIRDEAAPPHEAVVTRTVNVVEPTPGAPPPAPAPPCTKRLAFSLTEVTTTGCFARTGAQPEQWETTDPVKLNGIPFLDTGAAFHITFPTADAPGGRFASSNTAIQLGELNAYAGAVDWTLPDGQQGDEKDVQTLRLPALARYVGLKVIGSTTVRIGWAADGTHFATFPLNVQLPAQFAPGPDPDSGRVTGSGSLRMTDAGPQYDGFKIAAKDIWIGKVGIPEACFSALPAGATAIERCPAPTLDGEPYLTCETDVTKDRWDISAIAKGPDPTTLRYAVFGGLAGGALSNLGGFTDDFEAAGIQLASGVTLNRLGAGFCLDPPPLKLRGDVGALMLDGKLVVNGRFLYTDPFGLRPWSVELGGNAALGGVPLGDGYVRFNPWGDVGFGVKLDLDFEAVTLAGQADGWVEPRNDTFTIDGSMKGCLSDLCADARGLVSDTAAAGCLDLGVLVLYEPVNPRTGSFGFGSISFGTRRVEVPLRAGFGYRFATEKVDLLGDSCNFAPYRSTPTLRAAGGALTQRIAPGTQAVALRIHGTDGPPKVVVRGPDGTTITSAEDGAAQRRRNAYVLAENPTDGTTSVLLIKPAAGVWTVRAVPAAQSTPTRIERAAYEQPPTFLGMVRRRGAKRQLAVAYSVPKGATVRLVERGGGVVETIARTLRGRTCRGKRTLPGGRRLRCAKVSFRPARGPGGVRHVQAVVTRGGIPIARQNVAAFRAPRETLPSRLGRLRARRSGDGIVFTFPRSRGAARYTASAALSDGRRLGFDLGRRCRGLRIPAVPAGVAATIKVAGVRYDLRTGRYRTLALEAGNATAGPRGGRRKRRICT